MENHFQEQPDNHPDKQNYNTNKSKKPIDIVYGVLIGLGYAILCGLLHSEINYRIMIAVYVLALVICIVLKRPYLALGLFLIIVVPLAIFGGCMALLKGI